jgi:Ala-tRNA(Pro) deacylase
MAIAQPIAGFLNREHAAYTTLEHERAFTARQEAEVAHVPCRRWAKSVVCMADDEPLLAVLPADLAVDLKRLRDLAGVRAVRLATAEEVATLFPGCEAGAMPPFGSLFGQRTFIDATLISEPELVFNGGTFTDAICMDYQTFADLERPVEGSFAAWH